MSDDHRPDEPAAVVGPPFDAPDADIILHPSDGADIRTHKFILSFVSPVFRTMLSLPQPSEETTISSSSTLPIITMEEDGNVLERLLRPCYPGFDMSFDSLDDIKAVINAATKYDMQSVLGSLKKWIVNSSLFQINPLAFYAISCRQGWEAEARLSAAKVVEVVNFERGASHYVPELEDISGGTYYRLVTYHAQCGTAARTTIQDLRWFGDSLVSTFNNICNINSCPKEYDPLSIGTCNFYNLPGWFRTYIRNVGDELLLRPCASTVAKSNSFNKALLTGASCPRCKENLFEKLPHIRDMFAARVAKDVSQVQLEFIPPT
ncbi:hypothetical protein BJ138DRAFT_257783 [Hygrophoropsis aurantiaca]|uniref:Uncharacterized protein n=1 Tax=Hygrophoropsis aurantiaca TaxID=72124 RepID=A0ACB8A7K2_9AGAM|nr:hypothetical protein BJ138DRAFT_257783 [Hygrophoropsis aurantiaca]